MRSIIMMLQKQRLPSYVLIYMMGAVFYFGFLMGANMTVWGDTANLLNNVLCFLFALRMIRQIKSPVMPGFLVFQVFFLALSSLGLSVASVYRIVVPENKDAVNPFMFIIILMAAVMIFKTILDPSDMRRLLEKSTGTGTRRDSIEEMTKESSYLPR